MNTFKSAAWSNGTLALVSSLLLILPATSALETAPAKTNVANPAGQPSTTALRRELGDVVRLRQAGVKDEVIQAYVKNYPAAFHPSADEILALKEQGVSPEVLTAMIQHQGRLNPGSSAPPAASVAGQYSPAPTVTVQTAPTEYYPVYVPQTTYVNYPVYSCAYSYGWSYPWFSYYYSRPFYSRAYCGPYRYGWGYSGYRNPAPIHHSGPWSVPGGRGGGWSGGGGRGVHVSPGGGHGRR